ncbi:MAG: VanZ family protein, partial [Luteococcus japonicus]
MTSSQPPLSMPARPRTVRPVWLTLALAALALQIWLLYSTRPPTPVSFALSDKLVHLCMFGGVAGLFLLAGVQRAGVVGLSVAHAVASEFIQWQLVPGRSGSPLDVAADCLG